MVGSFVVFFPGGTLPSFTGSYVAPVVDLVAVVVLVLTAAIMVIHLLFDLDTLCEGTATAIVTTSYLGGVMSSRCYAFGSIDSASGLLER